MIIGLKGKILNHMFLKNPFAKNVFMTLATKVLLTGVGLISSIVIARYLGPYGKGVLTVLTAITGIALQFGNFGLHASNTYFVAKDRLLLPNVITNTTWLSIVIGSLIIGFIYLLVLIEPTVFGDVPTHLLLITVIALPFQFIYLFFSNILLGIQKIKEFNVLEIINNVIRSAIIIILLVVLGYGLAEVVISNVLLSVSIGITLIFLSWRIIVAKRLQTISNFDTSANPGCFKAQFKVLTIRKAYEFDFDLFKKMAKYGSKAYIAALLAYLVLRSDILMINYFLGASDVGVYSVAVNFGNLLYMLPEAIGMILFPMVSSMKEGSWDFTWKVTKYVAVIMAAVCFAAAILIKPIVLIFFGEPFAGAIEAFWWLLSGIWALSINTLYMNYFAGRGMPIIVVISPAIALAVNISLNFYFIPHYGIIGASITSSLSYTLFLLCSIFYNYLYFQKIEA